MASCLQPTVGCFWTLAILSASEFLLPRRSSVRLDLLARPGFFGGAESPRMTAGSVAGCALKTPLSSEMCLRCRREPASTCDRRDVGGVKECLCTSSETSLLSPDALPGTLTRRNLF
jgi:hypothetical protein